MGVRRHSRQNIRTMEVLVVDTLPAELYRAVVNAYSLYIPMEGRTQDNRPDMRQSECRYIQRPKDIGRKTPPVPSALIMLDEWIQQYNPYDYEIMAECIQITTYREGHFYGKHVDAGPGGDRVLSLTVQLNNPNDYEGGEFVFEKYGEQKLKAGQACIFNPRLRHEVQKVTKGTRHSMVAWFYATP